MPTAWSDIERLLAGSGHLDTLALRPGASPAGLDALERHLGVALPRAVRDLLARYDGQDRRAAKTGLFLRGEFLSADGIAGH